MQLHGCKTYVNFRMHLDILSICVSSLYQFRTGKMTVLGGPTAWKQGICRRCNPATCFNLLRYQAPGSAVSAFVSCFFCCIWHYFHHYILLVSALRDLVFFSSLWRDSSATQRALHQGHWRCNTPMWRFLTLCSCWLQKIWTKAWQQTQATSWPLLGHFSTWPLSHRPKMC